MRLCEDLFSRNKRKAAKNFFIADIKVRLSPRIRLRAIGSPSEETEMFCTDCTIQTFLLDFVSSSLVASAMIRLMGLYKYLGFLT